MASEVTVSSTTDTESEVKAALALQPRPRDGSPRKASSDAPAPAADPNAAPPAPASSAAPTPAPAASATEDADVADDDGGAPATEDQAASEAGRALQARKTKVQQRIDELVRKNSVTQAEKQDVEQQLAAARRETEDIRQRLAALEKGGKAEDTPAPKGAKDTPAPAVASGKDPDRPKPVEADFDSYADFTEALSEWKADQVFEARFRAQREQDERARREAADRARDEQDRQAAIEAKAAHDTRMAQAAAEIPDFRQVLEANKALPLSEPVYRVIMTTEAGPRLLYHLCQNPALVDELIRMPPEQQLMRVGVISHTVMPSARPATETAPAAAVAAARTRASRVPEPMAPVGRGSVTPRKDANAISSQDEYKAWRAQQSRAS